MTVIIIIDMILANKNEEFFGIRIMKYDSVWNVGALLIGLQGFF